MSKRPSDIINAILDAGERRNLRFTPLQVVKLAYIAHGWWLQRSGAPLVADSVQAWRYGPVFKTIYDHLKRFGRSNVRGRVSATFFEPGEPIGPDETSFIDNVVEKYGRLSGVALSNLTHLPETPWTRVFRVGERDLVIPNDLIKDHYDRLERQRRPSPAA